MRKKIFPILVPRLFSFLLNQATGKMGRKKYFCDFCLRFFNDDKNIRSKHLSSVAHLKAKSDHYDLFKDPEIILKENATKKPCRRFQNDGYCQFGSTCIYSHYTSYELDLIRQDIERSKLAKSGFIVPPPEAFFEQYYNIKRRKSSSKMISSLSHELPANLLPIADSLPVSMQPFNVKIYDVTMNEWG